jgi:hypothetical protein
VSKNSNRSIWLYDGVGISWDGTHRSLMEFYCNLFYEEWFEENYFDIISTSSVMLEYGDIGNKLYDMLIVSTTGRESFERLLPSLLEEFAKTVKIYEFIKVSRSVLLNNRFNDSAPISGLMIILSLIMESYNLGTVFGISSDKQKVLVSDDISVLQAEVYAVVTLNLVYPKSAIPGLKLSSKKSEKFKRYLSKKDKTGITDAIKKASLYDLEELLNNSHSSSRYSYVSNMYNEVSDNYMIDNHILHSMSWEREELEANTKSDIIMQYRFLLTKDLVERDFLKKRVLYVRDKGVIIKLKEPYDEIESISLREYHCDNPFEEHLLLVCYTFTSGINRFIPVDLTDLHKSITFVQYEKDLSALLMVFSWLGILNKIDISLERLSLYDWREKNPSEEELKDLHEVYTDLIGIYAGSMSEDNLTYEIPYQWNYSTDPNPPSSKLKSKGAYVDEIKTIGRYTRKLPIGQKASLEAQSLAKSVFIELEEGMTLVDEFDRRQRIRK